ncbi:MAG TPA: DIP1984 family protein [Pyrinomonadaceae bacterium]|nr:DIP1984 family protein [Pyrinomonadaceae bacterium]
MKLAEALILRADCQKRFQQLQARILRSAKVQEGDEPAENPTELIVELEAVSGELAALVKRINKTNATTPFSEALTLADVLAERDVLALRRNTYSGLAQAASVTQERYSRSEVKFKSTVSVTEIQKRADDLAKSYRELDSRIQELNWRVEMVE